MAAQLEKWSRNVDKNENLLEIAQAEQSLQSFGETVQCLRNNIFQAMQQGEQLAQVRSKNDRVNERATFLGYTLNDARRGPGSERAKTRFLRACNKVLET